MPRPALNITQNTDGLTIFLPAPGFRGSKSEIQFGLAFIGVVGFITAVFALVLSGNGMEDSSFGLMAVGVLGLFWLGAAASVANAWIRSRRRAIIDVVDDALLITMSMPFSKNTIQIERANIKALGMGPSGVVVDNVPVMALRLDLRKTVPIGKKNKRVLKLFRERSNDELEQIAEALREALDVQTKSDPKWAADAASSSQPSSRHAH